MCPPGPAPRPAPGIQVTGNRRASRSIPNYPRATCPPVPCTGGWCRAIPVHTVLQEEPELAKSQLLKTRLPRPLSQVPYFLAPSSLTLLAHQQRPYPATPWDSPPHPRQSFSFVPSKSILGLTIQQYLGALTIRDLPPPTTWVTPRSRQNCRDPALFLTWTADLHLPQHLTSTRSKDIHTATY